MNWRPLRWVRRLAINGSIGAIKIYQRLLSPLFGNACRFHPSCSNYMIGAIHKYGLIKGLWKGFWRITRCNPFHPGGFDPP